MEFWTYDPAACPRGAGDAEAHRQEGLTHAWAEGRKVCIRNEALHQLKQQRKPVAHP